MKRYKVIRPASREEWLEERKKGLGSSEVGTILGVNPYDTPYRLWRRKKGYDEPIEETLIMTLGHYLEPAVAQCFADATGAEIVKSSAGDWIAVDKEREHLRVSPDRIYFAKGEKHIEANKRILECKTTRLNIDEDNVPKYWYAQASYQAYVMGVKHFTLAWLTNGTTFGYKEFELNENFVKWMIEELDNYWNKYIIGTDEPAVMDVADTKAKYPISNATTIDADDKIENLCEMLKDVNKSIKELSEQKDTIENDIKMYLGENEALMSTDALGEPKILATWKTSKSSNKFNTDRFSKDYPELYEKYTESKVGSRRFSLK